MKKKIIIILVLFCFIGFSQTETNGSIQSKISTNFELNYILHKPENTDEPKPLIIFLHGSGEKGNDLEKLKIHGPLKYVKTNKLDAYILAPQCPQDKYWNSEELYLLIQKVLSENKIDQSRIYLTGLSMGAWGSWNLAFAHPELFAALVPIAGFVDRVPMVESCKIKDIPIRIFHGLQDNVVDVDYSISIFNKLRQCNKDIKLQIFDDAFHDSWTRVYDNSEIYDWMLKQKKILDEPIQRKLVWEENFNGKKLDETIWNFELGNGCPNCGWGNNERQLYTKANHQLKDGNLIITAKKEKDNYTSTRITTAGKKEFQYGRIEARVKLPIGQGIWPAFWMLGSNIKTVGWAKCGEIDIMEYVGKNPHEVYTTLHTEDSHGNSVNSKKTTFTNIEEGFHVFAIDWTKDKIEFFVDDVSVYTFQPDIKNENTWPFNQKFFILVNMAIGGNFGGPEVDDSIFPQKFIIDYIRVYQ
jgi:predicted esterase